MGKALLLLDLDQIQGYLFATDLLKPIIGASLLLDRFNRQGMDAAVGAKSLYANGGQALFLLDSIDQAEAALARVRTACRHAAPGATVTGAAYELPDGFGLDTTGYAEHGQALAATLAQAKQRRRGSVPVSLPILRPCAWSGSGPATCEAQYNPGETVCVSDPVDRTWRAAEQARSAEERGPWGRLLQDRFLPAAWADYGPPKDFDELALASSPRQYLALIYADGNSMGQRVLTCDSLREVVRLAETVDHAVHAALGEALQQPHLARYLTPRIEGRLKRRFEPLLVGGDDVVLAVPACCALDVASALARRYKAIAGELMPAAPKARPLTLSVGIAAAHESFPFGALRALAKSVLDEAKQVGWQQEHTKPQAAQDLTRIGYLVVTTANHLRYEEYVREDLTDRSTFLNRDYHVVRTMRPFTPDRLEQMRDWADRLCRSVPRSKLQQVREAVMGTPARASLDYLAARLHWPDSADALKPEEVMNGLAGSDGPPVACWLREPANGHPLPQLRTPFLDLVELLDLIPQRQAEEVAR